jgi:hypothetical protein
MEEPMAKAETTNTTLSRRSLVASAAALPALAMPAVVVAEPDPIFAPMRKYKEAVAVFNAYPHEDEHNEELARAMNQTQDEFYRVVPTTLEGFKAKVAFFLDEYRDGVHMEELQGFFDTLCKSACVIAGQAVQS